MYNTEPTARLAAAFFGMMLALTAVVPAAAEDVASVEQRLSRTSQFLASDELEGRGLGSQGIKRAAERIADEFRSLGLKTDLYDGTPFQQFAVTLSAKLGKSNRLAFLRDGSHAGSEATGDGSQKIELSVGDGFNPLAIGGGGEFELPVVFAGYGITSEEAGYDDYAQIDAQGKAVILLRHEPQQDNPHSAFDGTEHSQHATFRRKVSNAYQHGAAAILFVTDQAEIARNAEQFSNRWQAAVDELAERRERYQALESPSAEETDAYRREVVQIAEQIVEFENRRKAALDPLIGFRRAGRGGERRDIPILACRPSVIDQLLKACGQPALAQIEAEIDQGPQPRSFALEGWTVSGEADIVREETDVRNVVGVIEGEGPHADETVIIGAHFDHLGRGGRNSAKPGSTEIHNGADDNASGTAVLLEIARALASREKPFARRILIVAFTGEERGLLGSAEYCRDPLFPLESTVAMLNLDMVGRLKDDKLIVYGTGTAEAFDPILNELNATYGFEIDRSPGGFGPSDHSSFYAKQIPVLHFFTGLHTDYHRPSDDFQNLNIEGMRRVGELVIEMAARIADAPERPEYVAVGTSPSERRAAGDRPYFGSIPQFPDPGDGYAISGVTPRSPADRGGLKGGDKIVRLGEYKIGNLEDFDGALRKFKAGDRVKVQLFRDGQERDLEVTLDPPK